MTRNWKLEIRNWLRRWWIRQLIKLADRAEERLHDWQVKLRNDLCGRKPVGALVASMPAKPAAVRICLTDEAGRPQGETFARWEARRSGVAVVSKKSLGQAAQKNDRRRRGMTASAFDLRFAR